MSYSIQWDNADKTVVFQQYTDKAVKEDLYSLSKESAEMLKSVSHTVHLIIDESLIKLTLNTADINYLEKVVPANQGVVVVVYSKLSLTYKKMIHDTNTKLAPKAFNKGLFAPSVEEARQLLQEQFGVHYP